MFKIVLKFDIYIVIKFNTLSKEFENLNEKYTTLQNESEQLKKNY